MLINISILLFTLIIAFGMLSYRAWEIKTAKVNIQFKEKQFIVPFRKIEKTALYIIKHLIQGFLVIIAKYWFIVSIKIKKKIDHLWPKIHSYLIRKKITSQNGNLFIKRAIFESKVKIRRIKEKVKKENHIK